MNRCTRFFILGCALVFFFCVHLSAAGRESRDRSLRIEPGGTLALPAEGWRIDRELRFHVVYLPDGKPGVDPMRDQERVLSLGLTDDWLPDIDNIRYDAIRDLGFPLLEIENSRSMNLYLKLFHWPGSWPVEETTRPIIENYHLAGLPGGALLREYLLKGENVAVKLAWVAPTREPFTRGNPFPGLILPVEKRRGQQNLNERQPFLSLYIQPAKSREDFTTDNARAGYSTTGLLAFHEQYVAHLVRSLERIDGPDNPNHHYFRQGRDRRDAVFFKIPRAPMIFKNYRQLPMPQDPSRIFLSGLLLIHRTELKGGRKQREQVFEVGSVVRFP